MTRRQLVKGFVVGEHGDQMVPLWSTVRVQSLDTEELLTNLARLRQQQSISEFPQRLAQAKQAVLDCLSQSVEAAYRAVDRLPADLRVVLRPYVTHLSGAKTVAATANVTVDLVKTLLEGREIVISGQVQLKGEFYDIHTPLGVPIVVTPFGWTQVVALQLWEEEACLLQRMANSMQRRLQADLQHG